MQQKNRTDCVRVFRDSRTMEPAAVRLKRLRQSAGPFFTIRRVAEYLDMTPSSYAYYEDPKQFKKQYLPRDLTMKLREALPLDVWDILELGGIDQFEQDGEVWRRPSEAEGVKEGSPPPPALQLVTMQVALPSEAALTRMFEGLLLPLDQNLSRAELARTLAQRLPIGLGQLRELMPTAAQGVVPEADVAPQVPAKAGRALPRQPRT